MTCKENVPNISWLLHRDYVTSAASSLARPDTHTAARLATGYCTERAGVGGLSLAH